MFIKTLLTGVHKTESMEYGDFTYPISSSVTLLRTSDVNILIDSGMCCMDEIVAKLAEEDLTPEDIHFICHTHMHLDHTANDHFFSNAKVVTDKALVWNTKEGSLEVYRESPLPLPEELYIFTTPGHQSGHFSYLVDDEDGNKWVIAGDAFNEEFIGASKIPEFCNETKYWQSALKIASLADYIVPGHGSVIAKTRIDELKKIIESKLSQ